MNNCSSESDQLNASKLINKLYPHTFILKEEDSNKKLYFDLMTKFGLPKLNDEQTNQLDYQLVSVKDKDKNLKTLTFNTINSNHTLNVDLTSGNHKNSSSNFIMNAYHSSLIVDMALSHSGVHDFCLIGPQGNG